MTGDILAASKSSAAVSTGSDPGPYNRAMRRCDTLFYDAQCSLCRAWKQWIEQGTSQRPLTFVDANDKQHASALGIIDVQRLDRQMCLLTADGTTLWGYDALVGLIQHRSAAGSVAWVMGLGLVRTLGHWLYDQIASRRRCAPRQSSRSARFNAQPQQR